MRVLVTGGAGRLGRYVVDELRGRHGVRVFDAAAPDAAVPSITGDIRSAEQVDAAFAGVEAVIHLAAIPLYTGENRKIWEINVDGTFNVLEAAVRAGVRRIVLASSICAQGFISWSRPFVPAYLPVDEDHPAWPDDTYGLSKLIGEELCYAYARRYGVQAVALRLATIWFPFLPENTVRLVQRVSQPETLAGFLWNYVDARDAARAFGLALEHDVGEFRVLNIGAADTCSDVPTLELIKRFYPDVQQLRNRARFLVEEHAPLWDIGRARRELGYEPQHSWREYAERLKPQASEGPAAAPASSGGD